MKNLLNANSYATKPQVIDSGSKDNAFKVVTTMRIEQGAGAGSNIYALTVNEYDKSQKKPFIFLNNDVVFFGACEHFCRTCPTSPLRGAHFLIVALPVNVLFMATVN